MRNQALVRSIHDARNRDLHPGGAFARTVLEVREAISEIKSGKTEIDECFLADQTRDISAEFRALQSKAEYLLELEWAGIIIESENPWDTLRAYPYYPAYLSLVGAEHAAVSECAGGTYAEACFAGSGPFPISAIVLAHVYGIRCECVDRDASAVALSRSLIRSLGLQDLIHVTHADLADPREPISKPVFLAALAGGNANEKHQLLGILKRRMTAGTVLCARNAVGLGSLLYYPLSREELLPFTVEGFFEPPAPAVNSFFVARA